MTALASIAQDLPCPVLKYSPNCKLEDMGHRVGCLKYEKSSLGVNQGKGE